jgi:hypothetical protein
MLLITSTAICREAVSRAEVIQIAETYWRHEWLPTEQHAFHGRDQRGVRVDTPDVAFKPPNAQRGWWVPGRVNRGIPYMWGGFSSIVEFDEGLRGGKFAGDIYTQQKRRELERAVSGEAVGIDCSGLVSRCWKLPRSFSTRELPRLCKALPSARDLRAGDILNTKNAHVLLFKEWVDGRKRRLRVYEAGSPPTWKVLLGTIRLDVLERKGYKAYRYQEIVESLPEAPSLRGRPDARPNARRIASLSPALP